MNISYLLSVIDLYLKKAYEELNIEVIKYDEYVKFNFFYASSSINKTYISVDMNTFWTFLKTISSKVQKKEDILEELIDENNLYTIIFKNRKISFSWFNVSELETIRGTFQTNTSKFKFNQLENTEEKYDKKLVNQKNNYKFAFSMGFSSFITIFLSAIWFLDIFMIALWIFKAMK